MGVFIYMLTDKALTLKYKTYSIARKKHLSLKKNWEKEVKFISVISKKKKKENKKVLETKYFQPFLTRVLCKLVVKDKGNKKMELHELPV